MFDALHLVLFSRHSRRRQRIFDHGIAEAERDAEQGGQLDVVGDGDAHDAIGGIVLCHQTDRRGLPVRTWTRSGAPEHDPLAGEFYIGSADWMYRNLLARVEAVVRRRRRTETPEAGEPVMAGGLEIPAFLAAVASLGLYTASYVAEAIRSGVFAVGKGQIDAALSLGFTYREVLQKIILPQSFRTVIPPLGNLIIAMIKNSAILGASALAIPDLLKSGRIVAANTAKTHEAFFWAAMGYLILTVTATFIVRYLEKRFVIKR